MKHIGCAGAVSSNARRAPRSMFGEFVLFIFCWIGLALLIAPVLSPSSVHFVYNASDSEPRGWYVVEPAPRLHAGDLVLVSPPRAAQALAAHRRYLPIGVPLIKRIAAVAPRHVCVDAGQVRIDGEEVGAVLAADASGRELVPWHGCRQLVGNELFLLGAHPASFDSRYFGPVDAAQVLGLAHPLGARRTS